MSFLSRFYVITSIGVVTITYGSVPSTINVDYKYGVDMSHTSYDNHIVSDCCCVNVASHGKVNVWLYQIDNYDPIIRYSVEYRDMPIIHAHKEFKYNYYPERS